MSTDPPTRTAVLYLRSLLPDAACEQQATVCDHLDGLADDGTLDTWTAYVWGRQGPATPADAQTEAGVFALNRVSVFQEWADQNDCSLSPAFDLREVDATLPDRHYRAIVFPQFLLAEYENESLRCVTPHADPDGVVCVRDRLDDLGTGDPADFDSMSHAAPDDPPTQSADDPPAGDSLFEPHLASE